MLLAPTARLSRAEVSEYLKATHGITASYATLRSWASRGGGPRFQKAGCRALYPVAEIDAWAIRRLGPLIASTSELHAA